MPITHVLLIVDDEEGIEETLDSLQGLDGIDGATLIVTNTIQGGINMLADGDVVSLNRRLNG